MAEQSAARIPRHKAHWHHREQTAEHDAAEAVEGKEFELVKHTQERSVNFLGSARRKKGQTAPEERYGQHYRGRGQQVAYAECQPPQGDCDSERTTRPQRQPNAGEKSARGAKGVKTIRQQGHPDRLRLQQGMVKLPTSEAAANIQHVVATEDFQHAGGHRRVAEHKHHLGFAPRAQAIEAGGEQQRAADGGGIDNGIAEVVHGEFFKTARQPHEVQPGIEPPETQQTPQRSHLSPRSTRVVHGNAARASAPTPTAPLSTPLVTLIESPDRPCQYRYAAGRTPTRRMATTARWRPGSRATTPAV